MPSVEELAMKYRDEGYNCAESSLQAVCEAMGIKSNCVPRIASPFGAGVGRSGMVCGAISGSCMAIGLAMGRNTAKDPRRPVYDTTQKLVEAFVSEMKTPICNELTGFDMRDPDSQKAFKESGVSERVCAPAIKLAARLTVQLLKDRS